eukprot:UN28825
MMILFWWFCVLVAKISSTELWPRPVIGIVQLPISDEDHKQYIAASYVKWIESAGGRVVPISLTRFNETQLSLFNGVLFTGGGSDIKQDPYKSVITKILDFQEKEYESKRDYPIWGTCLGFESLVYYKSENRVLDTMSASNCTLSIDFKNNGASIIFPETDYFGQGAKGIF